MKKLIMKVIKKKKKKPKNMRTKDGNIVQIIEDEKEPEITIDKKTGKKVKKRKIMMI